MIYPKVKKAIFLKRPNRFIAHVLLDEKIEIVHVKNTGRCKEILKEGATVILEESSNPERKTRYYLICVYKGDMLINIDSQVPNAVVFEALKDQKIKETPIAAFLKREVTYRNSRFDLYFESQDTKGFIEVKGVTLEESCAAIFPDAPTERGARHIYEMIKAVEEGYKGYIFFLIQMKGVKYFTPNEVMDHEFTKALKTAKEKGVEVLAYDSLVSENEIVIGDQVKVIL